MVRVVCPKAENLRFRDESLATWHRDSGICLGWWPSSRCCLLRIFRENAVVIHVFFFK